MWCATTADPGSFLERTEGFLLRDPVAHNVLVTNIRARRDGAVTDPAPATYAAVLDGSGAVVGAAMRTPPHPVFLSCMPPAAVAPLVDAMVIACPDAAGVTGMVAEAEAFANAWTAGTGASLSVDRNQRLYRLDAVVAPPAPPGDWRLAGTADTDLLVTWIEAFELETGVGAGGAARRYVEAHIARGLGFVWIDGAAVSFVGTSPLAGGVVRVGPVYTPPDRRRRGYAAALVAAVSQRALDGGADLCALYTDLANPTSNSIYMAVGYRPVGDVTAYRFTSAGGTRGG
jgi:predicted GNAT family acetyltransferase